jgi:signal peptidase I
MIQRTARVITTTLWLGVCALILLLVFAFGPTLLGYETMIVTSGSMGKAMPVGSVAQTKLAPARSVAVGDVVSFRLPTASIPTTHRIVRIEENAGNLMITTKGDANATVDPQPVIVKEGESIQRVERVIPYAGSVVRVARGPMGIGVLFAIPILGLTFDRRKKAGDPEAIPAPIPTPSHSLTISFASTASALTGMRPATRRKRPAARSRKVSTG